VFVHGLRGHRIDTWKKDTVCWPRDLLSKEKWMSHVRILTFGYDGNVVTVGGRASMNTLFEHSINLLNELSRERRGDAVSFLCTKTIPSLTNPTLSGVALSFS
jgi:protein SERAC1